MLKTLATIAACGRVSESAPPTGRGVAFEDAHPVALGGESDRRGEAPEAGAHNEHFATGRRCGTPARSRDEVQLDVGQSSSHRVLPERPD